MKMLPITNYREEIVKAVENHAFTIITAETGSGKSTQVPQFLAETGKYSQIVVTQPRIMAAITLAKRVSYEMGVELGEKVGYNTGYEKFYNHDNEIIYSTDGLQAVKTIFENNLKKKNVLIIDEVHEWNLNIEVLIAWCKFMRNTWNTKVVIMSATMESEALAEYFGYDTTVLNIPGRNYKVNIQERDEDQFIDSILEAINNHQNVLAFVAGKKEIADTIERIKEYELDATVLPLHGEMDWEQQQKCFQSYSNPKVIVATNVAQTSITIDDIDVVVDSGEARITKAVDGVQGLYLVDISQADIKQRMGRSARTKDGEYILCSDTTIVERAEYTVPEIQRSILDRVVLQMSAIGIDAEEMEFFHQPDREAIIRAKNELKLLKALSKSNKITELGRKMVHIPVSVQMARMIVEAEKYGVTEQVMIISAIVEMGGLLTKNASYYQFTNERESDLLAELDVWNEISKMGFINFEEVGINKKNFFKIKEHIKKLREALYGVVELTQNDDRDGILKSCICGLASHVFVRNYDKLVDYTAAELVLDRNSCITFTPQFAVGIPRTIEFKNRTFGYKNELSIVSFVTKISMETFVELANGNVKKEETLRYSKREDAVEVATHFFFGGVNFDTSYEYVHDHPEYAKLKEVYENEQMEASSYYYGKNTEEQKVIFIDGKKFEIIYGFINKKPHIYLDDETLFSTKERTIKLDSGETLWFRSSSYLSDREESNIVSLRNAIEQCRMKKLLDSAKYSYSQISINSIMDVVSNSDRIGKFVLTKSNGGFGDEDIYYYGAATLKKNMVSLRVIDDEELANIDTLEAIQFLFIKDVEKRYDIAKFRKDGSKSKKKPLTSEELEVKKEFDSLVRELTQDLKLENIEESLEFLEEFYQELMN